MGLTAHSTGKNATDDGLYIERGINDCVVALAGNPNVGKSTVFNALTGMNQHTGNWPGKTVANAQGTYRYHDKDFILVDLPGTYSLFSHSTEEEVARDFICFGGADGVVVVCDATCLERNLNLVLQTVEITPHVVVCVNLMDEAEKKNIAVDLEKLQCLLGVPVVGASARDAKGLTDLMEKIENIHEAATPVTIPYEDFIEDAVAILMPVLRKNLAGVSARWLALQWIQQDETLWRNIETVYGGEWMAEEEAQNAFQEAKEVLNAEGWPLEKIKDAIVSAIVKKAEAIACEAVSFGRKDHNAFDRKLDKVLTSKVTGFPIMILLLFGIFWFTIEGANVPSDLLAGFLFWIQDRISEVFYYFHAPEWLHGMLVLGIYRVLAWVVSVMLPPMAIFFPVFTLLEDFGYLPRVAFNLDHYFKKACTCGKQALTMCMGFGCNAAGVIGCRIIDSPRERIIAMITNNFVPCNGRYPTLIAIISMFFVGIWGGFLDSFLSAAILTATIVFGVGLTFLVSRFLSKTLLKGEPSSFVLELPPYRKPQIGKVIVRSIFDRTLFVLGRAIVVAAPAGLIIWLMANIAVGDMSILNHCALFLDPFARLLGMDGVILLAFILGFPANEIVVPIMIMAYLSQGSLLEFDSLLELKALLLQNGWTWVTAVSTMLFCLIHWPCSTTVLTIHKESGSVKWTALAFLLPTAIGFFVCFAFASTVKLLGLV